jgi:hypothetical protein
MTDENIIKRQEKQPGWVRKFHPTTPTVYPAVGAKFGFLPADALFPIIEFYFRFEHFRREVESVHDAIGYEPIKPDDTKRVLVIRERLQATLKPARKALDKLNVANSLGIEAEAARVYTNVNATKESLREGLGKYGA